MIDDRYDIVDTADYELQKLLDGDKPNYKFREDELIAEFTKYIDKTYGGHYGQGGLQSSEVIVDRGHGIGFFLGNVDKYNGRYGKKGEPADHRKDIVKIIHYGFLALYEHDRIHSEETMVEDDYDYAVPDLNYNLTDARSLNDVSPQEWDRVGKAFLEKELAK